MAHFMACHPRAAELEEGKRLLKAKYAEAKRLGEQVVQVRWRGAVGIIDDVAALHVIFCELLVWLGVPTYYPRCRKLTQKQSRASVTELRQTVEQLQRWREDKASDAAALLLDAGHEEEMALVAEEEGKMLRELEEARGAYQVGVDLARYGRHYHLTDVGFEHHGMRRRPTPGCAR